MGRKTEAIEIGQLKNTIHVPMCYLGVELKHLCKNDNYKLSNKINVPLGFGLFWEKIVPIIKGISKKIGCKYLYIFAAADSKEERKIPALSIFLKLVHIVRGTQRG